MMSSLPCRLISLQFSQIRLTDARTFTTDLSFVCLAEENERSGQSAAKNRLFARGKIFYGEPDRRQGEDSIDSTTGCNRKEDASKGANVPKIRIRASPIDDLLLCLLMKDI